MKGFKTAHVVVDEFYTWPQDGSWESRSKDLEDRLSRHPALC